MDDTEAYGNEDEEDGEKDDGVDEDDDDSPSPAKVLSWVSVFREPLTRGVRDSVEPPPSLVHRMSLLAETHIAVLKLTEAEKTAVKERLELLEESVGGPRPVRDAPPALLDEVSQREMYDETKVVEAEADEEQQSERQRRMQDDGQEFDSTLVQTRERETEQERQRERETEEERGRDTENIKKSESAEWRRTIMKDNEQRRTCETTQNKNIKQEDST